MTVLPNQARGKRKEFPPNSDYISKTEERAMKADFDGLFAEYRGYYFLFNQDTWKIIADSDSDKNVHLGDITFEKLSSDRIKYFRNGKPNIKIINRKKIFNGNSLPDKVAAIKEQVVTPFVSALKTLSFPDSRTISLTNRSGTIKILACPRGMKPLFNKTSTVNGITILVETESGVSEQKEIEDQMASKLSKKFSVIREKK